MCAAQAAGFGSGLGASFAIGAGGRRSLSPLEVFPILDVLTEGGVNWPDDLAEFDPGYVIQDLGAEQRLPAKSKIAVQSMVRMAVMRRRACESLRIGQPRRKFVYRKKASPMPASPTKQAQPAIIIDRACA